MQAAEALRAAGADVVDFGAGEPDFDTPDNIKAAAAEAMRVGRTKYTSTGGTRELQKAIIDFYQREFQVEYQPSEVMGTSGGKQAIFNAVVTLLDQDDECLIPKPYWVTFPEIVVFAGAKPVFIETEETDFVVTAEQVRQAITRERSYSFLTRRRIHRTRVTAIRIPAHHGADGRTRHLRYLGRMLSPLCLPAGRNI